MKIIKKYLIIPLLLTLFTFRGSAQNNVIVDHTGAWIRSDTTQKNIYLMFTLHEYDEGLEHVLMVLDSFGVKASFFLTGQYISQNPKKVLQIKNGGHYIAGHSDKHLLYCDWTHQDSLLYSIPQIWKDYKSNFRKLKKLGIKNRHFCPPYEWCNKEIVDFFKTKNISLINMTPRSYTNADYTTPQMPNYKSTDKILEQIRKLYQSTHLNGYHFLIHPGTDPLRIDKFYNHLSIFISELKMQQYEFKCFGKKSIDRNQKQQTINHL